MTIIAQVAEPLSFLQPLLTSGPIGVVLFWFMFRLEKYLQRNSDAIDRMTRVTSIMVATSGSASDAQKKQVTDICKEVDDAKIRPSSGRHL